MKSKFYAGQTVVSAIDSKTLIEGFCYTIDRTEMDNDSILIYLVGQESVGFYSGCFMDFDEWIKQQQQIKKHLSYRETALVDALKSVLDGADVSAARQVLIDWHLL